MKLRARIHGGSGDGLHISLSDIPSGLRICQFRIPAADVGEVLFGGGAEIDVEVFHSKNHGKKREVDCVEVWIPRDCGTDGRERKKVVKAALAPFATDGWIPSEYDANSFNNAIRDKLPPPGSKPSDGSWRRVNRVRFVDAGGYQ